MSNTKRREERLADRAKRLDFLRSRRSVWEVWPSSQYDFTAQETTQLWAICETMFARGLYSQLSGQEDSQRGIVVMVNELREVANRGW